MSLRISNEAQSLMAQRYLNENLAEQQKSLEHLASGSRINQASDDAAGLALSEQLRAKIRSVRQNLRNAQDGISVVQTAEGGMNEISNILIRLRELAIESASDTVEDQERQYIDQEVQQLKQEVARIASTTEFNGKNLLNGEGTRLSVQVGLGNDDLTDRYELDPSKIQVAPHALGIQDLSLLDQDSAQDSLANLDEAQALVLGSRAEVGAFQNRLQSTINQLTHYEENLSTARGRITDADFAQESTELTRSNLLISAGIAVLSQANSDQAAVLKLL